MQKILFLSDLHGNMPATLAMEKEIRRIQPDLVWFLGDAIGKGPDNDQTLAWVQAHCDRFVSGNWDLVLAEDFIKDPTGPNHYYHEQIKKEGYDWLTSLPQEDSVWISGFHFRLIHGRIIDQLYLAFDSDEKLTKGFVSADGSVSYTGLICGDCHTPYVRPTSKGYALNCGSVGNSLSVTRAHALLVEGELDSQESAPISMSIVAVPYDNQLSRDLSLQHPEVPLYRSYANEVMTGVYSRLMKEFQDA